MRKAWLALLLILGWSQTHRCGTMARLEYLIQQDPTILARMAQVEAQTQAYIEAQRHLPHGRTNNVITIPVVVHIVYCTTAQNISNAQVHSQIDVLNEDFRRLNPEACSLYSPQIAPSPVQAGAPPTPATEQPPYPQKQPPPKCGSIPSRALTTSRLRCLLAPQVKCWMPQEGSSGKA
jgi:hypothetical protein